MTGACLNYLFKNNLNISKQTNTGYRVLQLLSMKRLNGGSEVKSIIFIITGTQKAAKAKAKAAAATAGRANIDTTSHRN